MIRSRDFKDVRRLIVWLLYASRGGSTRLSILKLLKERGPMPVSQIARALNLNYRTVIYHLEILESHDLVTKVEMPEGTMYALSEAGLRNWDLIEKLIRGNERR